MPNENTTSAPFRLKNEPGSYERHLIASGQRVAYKVTEYLGTGDAFFGGSADDRPLGKGGAFLRGCYSHGDVAEFVSRDEALTAVLAAVKRPGSLVGIYVVHAEGR